MQPFEVVRQADQVPFSCHFGEPAQKELPKTQHRLDNPKHWFHGAGPLPINPLTFWSAELVGHGTKYRIAEPALGLELVLGSIVVAAWRLRIFAADTSTSSRPSAGSAIRYFVPWPTSSALQKVSGFIGSGPAPWNQCLGLSSRCWVFGSSFCAGSPK